MQNTADTAEGSHRRLGRNLQYQTVPCGQTLAAWDFKQVFATSTAAKLCFSRGLQNISDSQKHSRVPFHISVLWTKTIRQDLQQMPVEERPIVAGIKMPSEALEVKVHAQHLCEISVDPFLKNSCFTESLHSPAGVPACHQTSWSKLLAQSRETSSPRAETDSCPHIF